MEGRDGNDLVEALVWLLEWRAEGARVGASSSAGTNDHVRPAIRVGFVTLALGALILGYLGFDDYLASRPAFGTGVLDLVYWDLQLFVMDSTPLQAGGDLPLALQIARFAAPAATLSAVFATAYAVLHGQVTLARARYLARRHTIICGASPALTFLASQLVAEGRQVVMIDPDAHPDSAMSGLPPQVLRIAGDPRDGTVLQAAGIRRAREVMVLTTDSAFNGEVAVTVRALLTSVRGPSLFCFAEVADPELCAELAARALGAGRSLRVQIVFFSRHDRTARRLLDRYPVAPTAQATRVASTGQMDQAGHQRPVAVVIVGDGQLKDVLVTEMRRRWSQATGTSGDSLPLLHKTASEIFDVQARTDLNVHVEREKALVPSHVFVCLEDDGTAIRAGLRVSRLLGSNVRHLVVATPVSTVFGRELGTAQPAVAGPLVPTNSDGQSGRLVLHNVTETVYAPEAVRRGDVEDIARAAHNAYVAACRERGETREENASMAPWDALPEFKKDDNRDQAADIGRKLAAVGATVVPASDYAETPVPFHDDEIELLAHMEHDRWVRRRREQGWSYGPLKDESARRHPDMGGWDELSAEGKEKDRLAVREIPTQLRAAGFAIVRGVD